MVVSDAPVFPRVDAHLVHPEIHEELHVTVAREPSILEIEALGAARGLAKGIVALCDVLEIPLDEARVARLDRLGAPGLEALLEQIRAEQRWP